MNLEFETKKYYINVNGFPELQSITTYIIFKKQSRDRRFTHD